MLFLRFMISKLFADDWCTLTLSSVDKCEAAPLHAIEEMMNCSIFIFRKSRRNRVERGFDEDLDFAFFDSLAQSLIIVIGLLLTEKRHRPYPTGTDTGTGMYM